MEMFQRMKCENCEREFDKSKLTRFDNKLICIDCQSNKWFKRKPDYVRKIIKKRDNFTCWVCNEIFKEEQLEVHHKIPISKGGNYSYDNLVSVCIDCHKRKIHGKGMRKIIFEPF